MNLSFFFNHGSPEIESRSTGRYKGKKVLLSSALRQFYSKTETDSAFEKPIMKKSRRCPK